MITQHGPIISGVVGQPDQKLAVNSMALRPNQAIEGWYRLNKAKNWDDFVDAMGLIEAPQLNVAYADVDNNIGYWQREMAVSRFQAGRANMNGWGKYLLMICPTHLIPTGGIW